MLLPRGPDYLEKVKNLVGAALNTMVEARPAKIVAGMEPENTNRLLQLLAVAATHCPDSTKAVAMVKGGGEGGARRGGWQARKRIAGEARGAGRREGKQASGRAHSKRKPKHHLSRQQLDN